MKLNWLSTALTKLPLMRKLSESTGTTASTQSVNSVEVGKAAKQELISIESDKITSGTRDGTTTRRTKIHIKSIIQGRAITGGEVNEEVEVIRDLGRTDGTIGTMMANKTTRGSTRTKKMVTRGEEMMKIDDF